MITEKFAVLIVYCIFLFQTINVLGESTFNYEISARVSDEVQNFLEEVRYAANTPLKTLESGAVNVTEFAPGTVYKAGRDLLYSLQIIYQEQITTFELGFENKFFFSYQLFDYLPNGMAMWASFPQEFSIRQAFQITANGLPISSYSNQSFDCTVNSCSFVKFNLIQTNYRRVPGIPAAKNTRPQYGRLLLFRQRKMFHSYH